MIGPLREGSPSRAGIVSRVAAASDAGLVYAAAYGMLRAELAAAAQAAEGGDTDQLRWALRRALTVEQVVETHVAARLAPLLLEGACAD